MKKLLYFIAYYCIFTLVVFSCSSESDLPGPVPGPDPKDDSTHKEEPDPPISYVFLVEATLSREGILDLPIMWHEDDSLFVTTTDKGKDINTGLHIESISDDKLTARFSTTLDFIPSEETKWQLSSYNPEIDYSSQDGTLDALVDYAVFSANAIGKNPVVEMQARLDVIRVELPNGVKTIECSDGFSTNIELKTLSEANDFVYIAMPDMCSYPILLTAKDESNTVFRCINLIEEKSDAPNRVLDVSIVERPILSASVKTPYGARLRGNFSGITRLGGNNYAVVSDLADNEGWFTFEIPVTDDGEIEYVSKLDFISSGNPCRDLEDITFNPSTNNIWLVAEDDNLITEHQPTGERSGNSLSTSMFTIKVANAGLESLTYNDVTKRYWTTTETGMKMDGGSADPYSKKVRKNKLRLQSYLEDGSVAGQWFYETDVLQKKTTGMAYAFGVSAMCALNDGRLLVMERETLV